MRKSMASVQVPDDLRSALDNALSKAKGIRSGSNLVPKLSKRSLHTLVDDEPDDPPANCMPQRAVDEQGVIDGDLR